MEPRPPTRRINNRLADASEFLERLSEGRSLDEAQAYEAISGILTEGWIGRRSRRVSLLTSPQGRNGGRTRRRRAFVARQRRRRRHFLPPMLDTCGTGGDRSGSFNVSTATALRASRRAASRSPSMATATCRASREAPTFLNSSASRSTCRPRKPRSASRKSASDSSSPHTGIRPSPRFRKSDAV